MSTLLALLRATPTRVRDSHRPVFARFAACLRVRLSRALGAEA